MRNFVYIGLLAIFAAGVYLFLGKKQQEAAPVTSAATESVPADQAPADANQANVSENASANNVPEGLGKLADFTLTDQTGKEFNSANMKGKVLLVNFFFTKCETTCPLMNKKMEALQEKFSNDADIKLVSISVDPENDNVDVLKTYSETFKANPEKWFFLTGSKELIVDIMEKQLKLAAGPEHATHSTRIVLIDKESGVKGYFDSSSDEELSKLESEARQLLGSAS